jgi:hypothetical protein
MIRSDLVWRIWHQNPHLHRQEVEAIVHAFSMRLPPHWRAEIASSYADSEYSLSRFMKLALAVIPGRE